MKKEWLIISLYVLAAGLLLALVALVFRDWSYAPVPRTVMIPGVWEYQDPIKNWVSLVGGGMTFALFTSWLFVSSKVGYKELILLIIAGGVWGSVSFIAGIFAVQAGLFGILTALGYVWWSSGDGRSSKTKVKDFISDETLYAKFPAFALGSALITGLKYGPGEAFGQTAGTLIFLEVVS